MDLSKLLENVYSRDEFAKINKCWLSREVSLKEVTNVAGFLEDCREQSKNQKVAGPHRHSDWEKGWSGDGIFEGSDDFPNIPWYFRKNTHVRVGGKLYEDDSGYTELCLLRTLQDIAFSNRQLIAGRAIIEYGCGTGHNIAYLKTKLPNEFYAADWAMSAVNRLIEKKIVRENNAFCVDYFKPETYSSPNVEFVAFTNASLEQTGDRYSSFMNYLFSNVQCKGGIHIEPISDLIKEDDELNKFSIYYTKSRNYLAGFWSFMQRAPINILVAKDYGIGSKFLSGYQLLVWSK